MSEQRDTGLEGGAERLCPTCGHRPHNPGSCKARYPVTGKPAEAGDPCFCENWRSVESTPSSKGRYRVTPRSAAERGPRTRAGQSLLRQWSGHVNEPEVRIVVLAIEAEATTAPVADAWQAGYEACWNRLRDAGRLLPSDGAAAARREAALREADLAMIRKALAIGFVSWDGDGWYAKDRGYDYDDAEATLKAANEIVAAMTELP